MHYDDRRMSLWMSVPFGCCFAAVLMFCVIIAVFVLDYFFLPVLFSSHIPPTLVGFIAPVFWFCGVALAAYIAASQGKDSPWKSSLLVGSIALVYLVVADRPNSEEFSKLITFTGRNFALFVMMSVTTIPAAFAGGIMHTFLSSNTELGRLDQAGFEKEMSERLQLTDADRAVEDVSSSGDR